MWLTSYLPTPDAADQRPPGLILFTYVLQSTCNFVIIICIYCFGFFWWSILYKQHLLHVCLSWERDPSSVALPEVSIFFPSVKGVFWGVLVMKGEECWYLPLFGVCHPRRPVKIIGLLFKPLVNGVSHNDILSTGPNLNISPFAVLLHFRK